MNIRLLFVGVLVIVAVAALLLFIPSVKVDLSSKSIVSDQIQTGTTNSDSTVSQNDSNPNSSRYIEYSQSSIDTYQDSRRILFFYASWCPTCRPADASFKENEGQIPEDLVVIRVNYNDPDTDADEKALAQKYQVTYQHTFVQIDADGNEITRWNGGGFDVLLANIK